jgi:hypothetical protein
LSKKVKKSQQLSQIKALASTLQDMAWSALDILVLLLFIAQLVGWGFVCAALLKIKKGPVTRLQRQVTPLAQQGSQLAQAAAAHTAQLKGQALVLVARIQSIRRRLDVTTPPEGMWIEPRHLQQALGLAQAFRQRRAATKGSAIAPARKKSVAMRLGLVPPALVRLAPLTKYAKIALKAAQQLRR